MIGTAFAAIANGINTAPSARNRATNVAKRIPISEPATKPQKASLNVYQPAEERVLQSSWSPLAIALGLGSRNCWTWNAEIMPSSSPLKFETKTVGPCGSIAMSNGSRDGVVPTRVSAPPGPTRKRSIALTTSVAE
jgi:hypothetical protein